MACLLAGAGAGGASSPPWLTYRDDAHHFSIELPATWLPASQFLATAGFAAFARRHPVIARQYRAIVRRGVGRFPFLAFDASVDAFRDANDVRGRSYGLFPTIFVILVRADRLPPIHDEVVPSAWQGGPGPGKQGCFLDKERRTETYCGYYYETFGGRLLMEESQIAGKPRGRPWLVVGLAFAHTKHYVDAARDEPNRTYQVAWHRVRYL